MIRCRAAVQSPIFPVALLIFLTGCTFTGTIKCIGIYLEDITADLGTTSTDIGIALGLFSAFSYIPSPLATVLYRQRPLRRVLMICGAGLTSGGMMLTSVATHKVLVSVFLSISGIGICLLTTCACIALSDVATRNFNLIWSLCLIGYGFGILVFPLIAEFLREVYGWRGGLLILGGLVSNIVPCAVAAKESTTSSEGRADTCRPSAVTNTDRTPSVVMPGGNTETSYYAEQIAGTEAELGSETSQRETDSLLDRTSTPQDTSSSVLRRLVACFYTSDFFVDPVFNLVLLAILLQSLVYCGWHAFLLPQAFQRGLSIHNILILTLFSSFGNISGRLFVGIVCNNLFHPVNVFQILTCLNFLWVLCNAFLPNVYIMMVTSCLSAGAVAGRSALMIIIARERASEEKRDVSVAVTLLCFGVGMLLGGYISGKVADVFSTYDAVFKLLAGTEVLIFFVMLIPMLIKKPSSH